MHIWQLQEAKAKLTEFVNEAKVTPQIISRHGKSEIIAMSMEKYHALTMPHKNLVTLLKNSPLYGISLDLERDKSEDREIDL